MKVRASEQESSLLELLQRQRVRALLATTEPLGLQRSATKSPKPNFNEVKEESRKEKGERRNIVQTSENKACLCFYNECSRTSTKLKEKQRSLVATLCRDDKHTIIFALYSLPCYLYSVICYLFSVLCSLSSKKSALPHGTLLCCTIAHYILYYISTFRGWYLQNIIIKCITARKSKLFPYPTRTVAVYGVTVLHFVFPVICWLRPSCSRSA